MIHILAALLIDAENISPKHASNLYQVLEHEARHGVSCVTKLLVGSPQSLERWNEATHAYHLQTKIHSGGKNAADHLLRDEALQIAQQGVQRFYLATNDRDFVEITELLRLQRRQVIVFGDANAAKQLQTTCDAFFILGSDPHHVGATIATLLHNTTFLPCLTGGSMSPFSPLHQEAALDLEKIREALQPLYSSVTQPPLLTKLLFLFLQHTFTALCLNEQKTHHPDQWSAYDDAATLATGKGDPIISFILQQDIELRTLWQTVQAFAMRCNDAYQQGRTAARLAFAHLPRHRFNVLQQEHLERLLTIWRYNPHASSPEALDTYSGYTPEIEQPVLLRWFRRGYLAGVLEPSEESVSKKPGNSWLDRRL